LRPMLWRIMCLLILCIMPQRPINHGSRVNLIQVIPIILHIV